jgi:hypothetical protein
MATERRKLNKLILMWLIAFWYEACPVPSGSKRTIFDYTTRKRVPVHVQRKTTPNLHKEYCERNPEHNCCIVTFIKYKPFNVKLQTLPTKANLIDLCPYCMIYKQLLEKKKRGETDSKRRKAFQGERRTREK